MDAIPFGDLAPAIVAYFASQPVAVRQTGPHGEGGAIETVWWSDADFRHISFTRNPEEAHVWPLWEAYRIAYHAPESTRATIVFERRNDVPAQPQSGKS